MWPACSYKATFGDTLEQTKAVLHSFLTNYTRSSLNLLLIYWIVLSLAVTVIDSPKSWNHRFALAEIGPHCVLGSFSAMNIY